LNDCFGFLDHRHERPLSQIMVVGNGHISATGANATTGKYQS